MAKTFAVLSGKGGVGKSSFCVNIAYILAGMNKKVLLIDGDAGLRNLDIMLGVESKVLYDWMDVIKNRCEKDKALLQAEKNIFLLPAPLEEADIDKEDMGKVLSGYIESFDFIFLDGPAGLGSLTKAYALSCDETLVLATPDSVSVRTAYSIGEKLTEAGLEAERLLLLVNKVSKRKMRLGLQMDIDKIIDETYIRLLGIIPEDGKVQTEIASGDRPTARWKSYRQIYDIAQRIMGEQVELSL